MELMKKTKIGAYLEKKRAYEAEAYVHHTLPNVAAPCSGVLCQP